jgi:hypothetical protein
VRSAGVLLGAFHATIPSRRLVGITQTSRGRLAIRRVHLPSFFLYVDLLFFQKKEKVQKCGPSLPKLQLSMILTIFIQWSVKRGIRSRRVDERFEKHARMDQHYFQRRAI